MPRPMSDLATVASPQANNSQQDTHMVLLQQLSVARLRVAALAAGLGAPNLSGVIKQRGG